ncbi:hypothetical protein [Synechococcus sp. MIT S9508]|uniref:hypothetical protein n=1 Tax=Synechococcus sp. MIT S9508 TaxID=1801629 RepID=UPI0007BC0ABB|nr:hypothetical protein [Synechococcus sp. MIT S9508]KZR90555.1 hypothetical protein MITS9508_00556 [Synechococcus sp. MIT S9508]
MFHYSLDWVRRWSSATGAALGLEVHKGIWLKYRIFGFERLVAVPWLPFWFVSDISKLKMPWDFSENLHDSINLPAIRFDCPIDDDLARLSAHAGLLHHVIVLGDSYEQYLHQLSKRVREKCRQAIKRLSFAEYNYIPNSDMVRINSILLREHCRLGSPCPPLHYIQGLLRSGLATLCIAREDQRIVGFFIYSSENRVFHVKWLVMDSAYSTNFTSIGLWNQAIALAFSTNQQIFSLGSTSQWGLSIFKERLGAKRALLHSCRVSNDGTVQMYANSKLSIYFNLVLRAFLRILTRLVISTRNKSLYTLFSKFCWMYSCG